MGTHAGSPPPRLSRFRFLGDRPEQLRATVRAIATAGATSVTPLVLHLRPGAREWFTSWLGQHHPYLVNRYERLYGEGA